LKKKDILLSQ